jgi:NDP-sugar pyrophosphorylase family protein
MLLVGGMGTRLRPVVQSRPKPLAPIGDSNFLELLVRHLHAQRVRRIVMCTGYLGDQIESYFGDGRSWDMNIEYSREHQALGTAGALKLAEPLLGDATEFFVLNGDTFLDINLEQILTFHRQKGSTLTLAVRQVENASRYGTVHMDSSNRVLAFAEKTGAEQPGLVNAGVYVCNRSVLDRVPAGPASLERDIFPQLLPSGIYALEQTGTFIDIGTPEDYEVAQQLFSDTANGARPKP